MDNLNKLQIKTDSGTLELSDNSVNVGHIYFDKVETHFKNLENALIKKIIENSKGFIFGSVAWLTSENIINALAKCENVQILIQKEDFLRPDFGDTIKEKERRKKYRELYSRLNFLHDKFDCHSPICDLSVCGDPSIEPIRCIGNYNSEQKRAMPRAHNKFLVFCKKIKESSEKTRNEREEIYKPTGVWTGSFNFTQNAERSFENGIYLEDNSGMNAIIISFLKEHHQIFALSESLDWESEWSEPEYRIGT